MTTFHYRALPPLARAACALLAAGGFALLMEMVQPNTGQAPARILGAFAAYYVLMASEVSWPRSIRYPAMAGSYLVFATIGALVFAP